MSNLKRSLTLVLLIAMPLAARSAAHPCDLLTHADVATVLPDPSKAAKRDRPTAMDDGLGTMDGCSWEAGNQSLYLSVMSVPKGADLKGRFERRRVRQGEEKTRNLGQGAVSGPAVMGPGHMIDVIASDTMSISMTYRAGAFGDVAQVDEQKKSALVQLVRKVLERL